MRLTPPKKSTFYMALILAVIGLILGIVGITGVIAYSEIWIFIGVILSFVGWVILALGVSVTGF
jgi:hypothetical protein